MDAETATKHIEEQQDGDPDDESDAQDVTGGDNSAIVKATAFDVMLSGDSRVWKVISNRKKRQVKYMGKGPPRGPTVGRRRKENKEVDRQDDASNGKKGEASDQRQFSIGSGFELPLEDPIPTPSSPVKDSLMEALNALDHDEKIEKSAETEEIGFDSGSNMVKDESSSQMQTTPNSNKEDSLCGNETPTTTSGHDLLDDIDNDDLTDMDALLASVEDGIEGVDLEDFDDDDDLGLDDFESMLNS